MPSMQNIVLKDAADPVVNHTFTPMSLRNDLGSYVDKSGGSLKARPSITIGVRPATTRNQGHKVTMRLHLPHVTTPAEGECCVPGDAVIPFSSFEVVFMRHNVATDLDVNTLLSFLADAVQDSQFVLTAQGESLR